MSDVYTSACLITQSVSKVALNWTTDVDSNVADSKILQLEPRDASKDRYFSVATLNGTNDRGRENHCYPGIPLDTALLREQEQDNRFECSRVIIHFQDLQGKFIAKFPLLGS